MKLKPSFETTVSVTNDGYYRIEQPASCGDDQVILLTVAQCREIIRHCERAMADDLSFSDEAE